MKNPDAKLWLYQEIWPEEHPADNNYLGGDYNTTYQAEIKMDIDAIHGRANIAQRTGRAYGYYTADVSPYIVGYLVGREMEPEEVISTNEKTQVLYLMATIFTPKQTPALPRPGWR